MKLLKSALPAGMDKQYFSVMNICRSPEVSRLYISKDLNVCNYTEGGHVCHLLMTLANLRCLGDLWSSSKILFVLNLQIS